MHTAGQFFARSVSAKPVFVEPFFADPDFAELETAESGASKVRVRFFSWAPAFLCFALFWPFGSGKKVRRVSAEAAPAARGTVHI